MKILQVISSFPPAYAYGGPAKVAYDISKELVKRGHEVTVYTTDACDAQSRLTYDDNPMWMDGIEVYHFKNVSNKLAHRNFTMAPMMAVELNKNINDFDIVHINEYRTFLAAFAHHYAKKYKIPYILQPRGTMPTITKSIQKKIFDTLFGHVIARDASKIIATSKIESEQYLDVFPELDIGKIVHVPNGIDLQVYANLPKKGEFKKKHSINENDKVILFLSRIHERKGADVLIMAFSEVKIKLGNIKLVIAGPDEGHLGKLKDMARNLNILDDMVFPGSLYGNDKMEAYVDADVFVLPSKDRYESFGNVVLEAMACGTPVIVTNNCGISEWITDDVGCVVECDKEQLHDAILKVLINDSLKRRFGEDGRKLVGNNFNWDKIVTAIERLYEEIIHLNEPKENIQ